MENRQGAAQEKSNNTLMQSSSLVLNGNNPHNRHYMAQSPFTYDVMIEKSDSAYIARILFWPQDVIIADTRDEALEKAQATILRHLSQAEFVTISVDPQVVSRSLNGAHSQMGSNEHKPDSASESVHPLSEFFGMNKEYPDELEEMEAEISRYRDEIDKEWGMGKYMVDDESTDSESDEANHEELMTRSLSATDTSTKKAVFA